MVTFDLARVNERIAEAGGFIRAVQEAVGQTVVGQRNLIDRILIAILSGGHILLEGVPGLAKTLTVTTLAATLHCKFRRIQFTPDLLPADLIGTLVYNQREASYFIKKGPIFANLILADEINRAPAKVQSALLECMQERQVTIGETTFKLEEPFHVLATQNPIEQEGTYPLPEAQTDRFMMKVLVSYPTAVEELEIMRRMATTAPRMEPTPVADPQDLLRARSVINELYMDERVEQYIVSLIVASREPKRYGLEDITGYLRFGASPRAAIYLNLASRAHAFLNKRGYVTPDDVRTMAPDVLRHRLALTYEAEAEDLTSDMMLRRIMDAIEVP